MQRDRAAESRSPDSVVPKGEDVDGPNTAAVAAAAAAASSRAAGNVPAEREMQEQRNGKKPRLVWTPELHDAFVRACATLGRGNSQN
jgi:hypothetical protein